MNRKKQYKALMAKVNPTVRKGPTWQQYQIELATGVDERIRLAKERRAKILDEQVTAEITALMEIQASDKPTNIVIGAW